MVVSREQLHDNIIYCSKRQKPFILPGYGRSLFLLAGGERPYFMFEYEDNPFIISNKLKKDTFSQNGPQPFSGKTSHFGERRQSE